MDFVESPEQQQLRAAVAALASSYGSRYVKGRSARPTAELWDEAGRHGYLGVSIPAEYGGGGGGIYELHIVAEELATAGCPLLLIVVSPAICGTVIAAFGTAEQKKQWLPGLADGSTKMVFAITEPDAGTNSHRLTTVARRDGTDWVISGRKVFISGVDEADYVLVVGRTEDARSGKLKPCLFVVPPDSAGLEYRPIEMAFTAPEKQFAVFLDDVRVPAEALVGSEDAGLLQLFAGLNPERITVAGQINGLGRYALDKAASYGRERQVWSTPVGAHQGVAHPLAQAKIEVELARLMTQKAASLYDAAGTDSALHAAAGEAANMAKYAAAEAANHALDRAIQIHGGNGMTVEYGLAPYWGGLRAAQIAPVSREMILNFVAQHSLGLPKSY
jgi:alkylation response protein AidB-like acyl-CoA dehydrogenase